MCRSMKTKKTPTEKKNIERDPFTELLFIIRGENLMNEYSSLKGAKRHKFFKMHMNEIVRAYMRKFHPNFLLSSHGPN